MSEFVWTAVIKISSTGRLMNNRKVLLTVLEAGKPKIMALANSMSGESQLLH